MRYLRALTAAAVVAILGAAAPALAQGAATGSSSGEITAPAREPATAEELADLTGTEVVTEDGETVGVLARVLAGQSGHAAAIIEMGERGGRDTGVVVPAERLRIEADNIVLEMTAEEIEDLPGYEEAL